jgi:hypothetical protein
MDHERREFQRLTLDPTVPASFGTTAVSILEIGVLGARIHHGEALDIKYAELLFSYAGQQLALRCEVVRTVDSQSARYPESGVESGVRFLAAIGESGDRLRTMLAQLVEQEMQSRPNPPREALGPAIDGDKTVRGTDAGYLCYRFEHGVWQKRRVLLPEQPPNGFTVVRSEDSDEMQRLCRVYQASDEEGQRLIRLFAELSVSHALQIPPNA